MKKEELEKALAIAREALEFYADDYHWDTHYWGPDGFPGETYMELDRGIKAGEALKKIEKVG